MGNTASSNGRTAGLDSLVGELGPDVQYERSMGDSRFLKTIKARHTHGVLVVKTFFKPQGASEVVPASEAAVASAGGAAGAGTGGRQAGGPDGSVSLADLVRKLRKERERLATAPNVLTYQTVVETENAGYLIRQWLASSLYDRISTRPFLAPVEKRWLTFQLLQGMRAAHGRGVAHGDLKSENILVTSSLTLYISDFAGSIKPTYLPLDDPDDFGVFFDTSGRRVCYLAPERFFDANSQIARGRSEPKTSKLASAVPQLGYAVSGNRLATMSDPFSNILGMGQTAREGSVTEQMDVFGAGCVIAELWRDGTPTFTLSQLFAYRRGQLDLDTMLAGIPDAPMRDLVRGMLAMKPGDRATFSDLLEEQRDRAFPSIFYDLLYPYLVGLQRTKPTTSASRKAKASLVQALGVRGGETSMRRFNENQSQASQSEGGSLFSPLSTSALRSESDERLDRLYADWPALCERIGATITGEEHRVIAEPAEASEDEQRRWSTAMFPITLHIPGIRPDVLSQPSPEPLSDSVSVLLLSVALSNLRNATRPSTKVRTLELCLHMAKTLLTDLEKLDRLLPYMVSLFNDASAVVRAFSGRAATQLLLLVRRLPASNQSIWTEYVVPQFQRLRSDPSILVRSAYAASLGTLVQTAKAHMLAMRESPGASDQIKQSELDLEECLQVEVAALLQDESNTVKRTLLADANLLCTCFGASVTNDIILSHMTTYLNNRDWRLRQSFFEAVVHIAPVAKTESMESYVLPFVMEALHDPQEAVVLSVVQCLQFLVRSETLRNVRCVYEIIGAVSGFLCHPNIWLRHAASSLIAACSARLGKTERWAFVYPHVRPLLRGDARSLSDIDMLSATTEPLARAVYKGAILWAARSQHSEFWTAAKRQNKATPVTPGLKTRGMALLMGDRPSMAVLESRSEEDDAFMDKLRGLGMHREDELKLMALRGNIWRQSRKAGTIASENDNDQVFLQTITLGDINPQNVFFGEKGADSRRISVRAYDAMSVRSQSDFMRRITDFTRSTTRGSSRHPSMSEADDRRVMLQAFLAKENALTCEGKASSSPPPAAVLNDAASDGTIKEVPPGSSQARAKPASATEAPYRVSPAIERPSAVTSEQKGDTHGLAYQTSDGDRRDASSSTYDGSDPYLQAHLAVVQEQRASTRSSDRAGAAFRPPRTTDRLADATGTTSNRKPGGQLVAYFDEHAGAITSIAVSSDHKCFCSASADGTIRVWDAARLEKNVTSKARATYTGHHPQELPGPASPITCCIALSQPRCFVSAAQNGSVHVWRVDATSASLPRYARTPKLLSNFQFSRPSEYATCLLESAQEGAANLILGTSQGRLIVLDIRTMQVLQILEHPPHIGSVSALCESKSHDWLVAGTSRGQICLWDLRFGLLLQTWRDDKDDNTRTGAITSIVNHPDPHRSHSILVGLRDSPRDEQSHRLLVEEIDVQTGQTLTALAVGAHVERSAVSKRPDSVKPAIPVDASAAIEQLLAESDAADIHAGTASLRKSLAQHECLALVASSSGYQASDVPPRTSERDWVDVDLPENVKSKREAGSAYSTVGKGWCLTGGTDRVVRFWDLARGDKSLTVTPPHAHSEFRQTTADGGRASIIYTRPRPPDDAARSRSPLSTGKDAGMVDNVRYHRDAISSLAVLEFPFRCIVAGDRSGKIMVWE